jgi:hypothetical protein
MDRPKTESDFGEPLPGRERDSGEQCQPSWEFLEHFWERQLRRLKEHVEERANQHRTVT